jgi:hypothetical protein
MPTPPLWPTLLAASVALMVLPSRSPAQATPAPPRPAARPEDVRTIDGIVRAFYEIVSGPGDQPRDWARDSTLYIDDVRFVAGGADAAGAAHIRVMTHREFAESSAPVYAQGFYERELHRVTRRYGNIAHVFSTYETRTTPTGPVDHRGVNSLQLFFDGARWWIASATWQSGRPGAPIPAEFLPKE